MGSDKSGSSDDPWWYQNRQRKIRINDGAVRAFLRRVSDDLARGREVAVVVASDETVRRANREFRGKAGSTDVLSFVDDEPGRLGDILISAGRAKRQSDEFGHATTDEIKTLILHGFLHLLGYDHETDRGRMRRRENQLRRKYGLATTLTGRAAS